jgi:transcriptional regulator with XRE-family HTH domain
MMTLDQWMVAENMSTREMAAAAECSPATISKIRHGKMNPTIDLADRISAVTRRRVTVDDLIRVRRRKAG